VVGTGDKIYFWIDNWLGEPLVDILHIDPMVHINFNGLLSDVITNGAWNFPAEVSSVPAVSSRLSSIVLPSSAIPDLLSCPLAPNGKLTAKFSFSFLKSQTPLVPWASVIWKPCIRPSHSFSFWRLAYGRMPIDETLCSRGCAMVSMCSLYSKNVETSDHLFLHCDFAVALWNWLGLQLHIGLDVSSVQALINSLPRQFSSQVNDMYLAAIVHVIHSIWWARNRHRFSSIGVSLHAVQVKVHSLIGLSGGISTGKCIAIDAPILDFFQGTPSLQVNQRDCAGLLETAYGALGEGKHGWIHY